MREDINVNEVKMNKSYEYAIGLFSKLAIKHEVHTFSSGVKMVDVWYNKKFYVLQFENDLVGFSDIGEDSGFDTVPDEKFNDMDSFKQKLDTIFRPHLIFLILSFLKDVSSISDSYFSFWGIS